MFKNYKKLYKNLVNKIEGLWNFYMEKYKDINEYNEGYFNALSDFYVDYLSKYKVHDQISNIKIINYKKRYLDIVERITNLYFKAADEYKFYGPDDKYIYGFFDCTRDLIAIIAIVSK